MVVNRTALHNPGGVPQNQITSLGGWVGKLAPMLRRKLPTFIVGRASRPLPGKRPFKPSPPCRPPTAADRIHCKLLGSASLTTRPPPLTIGGREFAWGRRTYVMGVLNITLDSFSGDGLGYDVEAAVAQGRRFAAEGADILDVGGESTRPGFDPVSAEEEIARALPVIERLLAEVDIPSASIRPSRRWPRPPSRPALTC